MDGKLTEKCRHNKKRGTFYEYKFFSEAMKRGYEIFVPAGDHLPQDCHLVNSDNEIFRIQIKGTDTEVKKWKTSRYRISAKSGRGGSSQHSKISCTKVDYLVAYVEPHDVFYIVPCSKIKAVNLWLYPNSLESQGQFEKYKEDWSVFTC